MLNYKNTPTRKKILLLSTNSSDAKLILWCLHEAGYHDVILLGNELNNVEIKYFSLCKNFIPFPDNLSYEEYSSEIVELIRTLVGKYNVDIILPSGFSSVKFLSKFRNQIKEFVRLIPTPQLDAIDVLGNKLEFFRFCSKNGIPHPPTYLLENLDSLRKGQLPVKYPIMTKPLALSSSKGILKFAYEDSLIKYLSDSRADKFNALPLLLQEYIPGPEIDFNGFATNGHLNAWTIQKSVLIPRKNKPHLRWLEFQENDEIYKIGESIVNKTNYSGPIHIDLIHDETNGQIYTLEVNPRFWATTFASNCDGVNFIDVAVKSAFDPQFLKRPRYSRKVWGSPLRAFFILFSRKRKDLIGYSLRHTFLQIKFIYLDSLFKLIAAFKSKIIFAKWN